MFNPNLIIIKDKKNVLGIHQVKYDYIKNNYCLKINTDTEKEVFNGNLNQATYIDLDISLGFVTIEYYDKITKEVFFKETLNLNNYIDKSLKEKSLSIDDIIKNVCYELDNPKGNVSDIEQHTLMLKNSAFDKKARYYVESKIRQILLKSNNVDVIEIDKLVSLIYANHYGMGAIQELDDDEDVSEIMVNASLYPEFNCDIYYIKTNQGKKKYTNTFKNIDDLLNVFSKIISFSKVELNNLENALIETTRPNGDRVNIIIPGASENYILNIRKFANFLPTAQNMIDIGTINKDIDNLMNILVRGKANIGIGGEMGTGKTTFINYLLSYTDPIERKAVISGVKEINTNRVLDGHDIVFLNIDDDNGFSFQRQMRAALRTTADRIIVPEARGGEFKQVYEANLKTKGNIFTAHATTANAFLDVCADMYMENSSSDISFIKNKIAKSIDVIIIMTKINNKIRIKSISEVLLNENSQLKGLNLLYYWDYGDEDRMSKGYIKTDNPLSKDLKRKLFEEGVSYDLINNLQ